MRRTLFCGSTVASGRFTDETEAGPRGGALLAAAASPTPPAAWARTWPQRFHGVGASNSLDWQAPASPLPHPTTATASEAGPCPAQPPRLAVRHRTAAIRFSAEYNRAK